MIQILWIMQNLDALYAGSLRLNVMYVFSEYL